jgi:hypothetical protein
LDADIHDSIKGALPGVEEERMISLEEKDIFYGDPAIAGGYTVNCFGSNKEGNP